MERLLRLNELRCGLAPIYGTEVLNLCTLLPHGEPHGRPYNSLSPKRAPSTGLERCRLAQLHGRPRKLEEFWERGGALGRAILGPPQRLEQLAAV